MRRDDDLIRKLMMDLEAATSAVNDHHAIEGYSREEVAYHLGLIVRSNLGEGPKPLYPSDGSDPTIPLAVIVMRLTPRGHEFIGNLRDDTVWKKVKERTLKAGGSVSLELLGQIGGSVIKKMVGLD